MGVHCSKLQKSFPAREVFFKSIFYRLVLALLHYFGNIAQCMICDLVNTVTSHANTEKVIPSSPNRRRAYDLPSRYRGFVGFEAIKLFPRDKPAYSLDQNFDR